MVEHNPQSAQQGWRLVVCVNRRLSPGSVSCAARGSPRLAERLADLLADQNLPVVVETIHCFGRCGQGPNIRLAPGGEFFRGVGEADLPFIVDRVAHLIGTSSTPTP